MKTFGGEGRPGARRVRVAGSLVSDRALVAVVPAAEEAVPAGTCSGFPRWAGRLCLRPVAGAWRYAASARRLAAGLPPRAGPARSGTARRERRHGERDRAAPGRADVAVLLSPMATVPTSQPQRPGCVGDGAIRKPETELQQPLARWPCGSASAVRYQNVPSPLVPGDSMAVARVEPGTVCVQRAPGPDWLSNLLAYCQPAARSALSASAMSLPPDTPVRNCTEVETLSQPKVPGLPSQESHLASFACRSTTRASAGRASATVFTALRRCPRGSGSP